MPSSLWPLPLLLPLVLLLIQASGSRLQAMSSRWQVASMVVGGVVTWPQCHHWCRWVAGNRQQVAGVVAVVVIHVYKTKSAVILTRKRQQNTYGLEGIAPLSPLLLLLGSIAVRDGPWATRHR